MLALKNAKACKLISELPLWFLDNLVWKTWWKKFSSLISKIPQSRHVHRAEVAIFPKVPMLMPKVPPTLICKHKPFRGSLHIIAPEPQTPLGLAYSTQAKNKEYVLHPVNYTVRARQQNPASVCPPLASQQHVLHLKKDWHIIQLQKYKGAPLRMT